ncbi:MAG TPA: 30S ribosomal protein S17e [Candidatus Caldiarchaeum subterraneum]|uniref:Small ribosomal subunit protein eS17 n=1 Tax=Caldiarchaeum subterraneum TaxID=311458 RepID=A0A833EB75_CALS0|nr:30S ribosomal protein S17e [Candidatus Caldarchaeum subterraneum]
MGKVRTRKVKTLAREILETYKDQISVSFEDNKRLVRSVLQGRFSKRLANRVAGYLTSLAKRTLDTQQQAEETKITEEQQSNVS